ncbi:phage minor head protein [uncultured Fibrobacter sp.]|uniref:phage minor head protein n=1 Tax=uncultured Fibrobacter sp. TaxID=261512 RepID=UPI00262A85C0|nr:phage minor head protein [uncultured Fibrobacter sp.]
MASESTYTPLRMAKELYMLQNNGKRKRGRKPVFSASQFYPWKVELEMKEFIASMLRDNGKQLKELALLGYQADGLDDVNAAEVFTPSNIEEKAGDFFREVSDFSSRKMDDFAEKTVGRTIGYIPNQSKLRDDFVNNFVANCKSAAEDQKKEIAAAVYKHRMFPNEDSGSLVKEINAINTKYTKNKSKFIARNETGNLNGAIQRTQMEGAGFRYYKWMSMLDGVTRDTHRSMNGLVCKWEDDTVYSDDGGKTWKKRTGSMFIGQPGQDYNCRCTAIPFDPELEDDYEVKEMPEEKPDEKETTPLEKAREEAEKAVEENKKLKNFLENPLLLEKRKNEILKESQAKSKSLATKILEERKKTDSSLSTELLVPIEYQYRGKYTLVDLATLRLAKKNKKEYDKFVAELKMSKLVEDQHYKVSVFIGETSKGKNPDAVIGGIVGEYKHTEPESGRNAISGALREALHQGSKIVIIDVQSDVNYQDAWNAINGRIKGKDDIEVYFKLKGNETIHLFKKK